jgi:hypothetical protein
LVDGEAVKEFTPSPRKGSLEARIASLIQSAEVSPESRFKVIAYELTHDGCGWSVNSPFCILSEGDLAECLEASRGRWEVYKANYDSRATVTGIADISDEPDSLELESGMTPFLRIEIL